MSNEIFSNKYPFQNPPLPYGYDSLEPHIDSKTMHLHHDKHLQAYVDNLNKALADQPQLWGFSLQELITKADKLPDAVKIPIWRNAGGVYNHVFYFYGMTDNRDTRPSDALNALINRSFQSYDGFKKAMKDAALGVFGSGYAWLVTSNSGELSIVQTANQDTALTMSAYMPLLNIDVWEHAYYLKNYNRRDEYIDNWFNVINWKSVEHRMSYTKM